MKRLILPLVLYIFISGCASMGPPPKLDSNFFMSMLQVANAAYNHQPLPPPNPFASQYVELDQAYQAGKLTYPEYLQARQNLQAQELQWRNNMVQAIQEENRQQILKQSTPSPMQKIREMSPVNTNCYQIGNQTNCQSY